MPPSTPLENGRVMCLSLDSHNIGRPNAAKHLHEALRYILGHDGVWATTADDIAEYYLANYYAQVKWDPRTQRGNRKLTGRHAQPTAARKMRR